MARPTGSSQERCTPTGSARTIFLSQSNSSYSRPIMLSSFIRSRALLALLATTLGREQRAGLVNDRLLPLPHPHRREERQPARRKGRPRWRSLFSAAVPTWGVVTAASPSTTPVAIASETASSRIERGTCRIIATNWTFRDAARPSLCRIQKKIVFIQCVIDS